MGLGYKPQVVFNGSHSGLINERLVKWEYVDFSGNETDRLTAVLDVTGIEGIPKEGSKISLQLGYSDTGLVSKGEFTITGIKPQLQPRQITITGSAAPFQVDDKSAFRLRKSRSFENVGLGELFKAVVAPHGFSPRIDPELECLIVSHVDQKQETDSSFLTRLANQYDAVCKPVDDLYVLARRGRVKAISGQALPPVAVDLPANNTGAAMVNGSVNLPSRTTFKGVRAYYWDKEKAKQIEIKVGTDSFRRLPNPYNTAAEAQAACEHELRRLARVGSTINLTLPGDPNLVAEGLLTLSDSFPAVMIGTWSIDRVRHYGDKQGGYRCDLQATKPL
ncbi:contractile injection system protein, VgrG/Pvc8 family [Spartinivicinus ruber]|uniref:contractile injection system protein, VgrG/Pvc8 family n=1 Tax=Spartinivicinus ruber TaxID=2683272 RepID=UPI0013D5AC8B|nr:contractile injection system protein, VgrG/Pvc8 family [Spartinivicinus ruber]